MTAAIRAAAGMSTAAAAPGNWVPYFNVILSNASGSGLRVDQKDAVDARNTPTTTAQDITTLDGTTTLRVQNTRVGTNTYSYNFSENADDRISSGFHIGPRQTGASDHIYTVGLPAGDYLIDVLHGGSDRPDNIHRLDWYDGTGWQGGQRDLFASVPLNFGYPALQIADSFGNLIDYSGPTSPGVFNRTVNDTNMRAVTITERGGAFQTGLALGWGFDLTSEPTAPDPSFYRLAYIRTWVPGP